MTTRARNLKIETLRGLACLLLVAYHAVGDDVRGLRLPPDAWLRWLSDTFVYLRMPLFTFLSGYVYAMRPARPGDASAFFSGKVRRLLLPLLFVGLIYRLTQNLIESQLGGINQPSGDFLFSYLLFPYDHFWYLQSLFIIFAAIYMLEVSGALQRLRSMWIFTAISFAFFPLYRFDPDWFSINGALYLMPYFLLGMAFYRTPQLRDPGAISRRFTVVTGLAALALTVLHECELVGIIPRLLNPDWPSGQLYSALAIAFVYSLSWQSSWLVRIGAYSYSIYLFHVFGTAGGRIVAQHLGIARPELLFLAAMLAGVCGPIVLERILDRWNPTRVCLLGRGRRDRQPAERLATEKR